MRSGHTEVAYNEPPIDRYNRSRAGHGFLLNAPIVGWRFYPASSCELSIRNLRRDNHPAIGSHAIKWVLHQEPISINHGTNWLQQCPPNPTNSKWVDAKRDNRLSHLSFNLLTRIGVQMWKDNKIEKKFFYTRGSNWHTRLAMDLDRADLVTELLRLDVQAPSVLERGRRDYKMKIKL